MTNEGFHDALYRERCRRETVENENRRLRAALAELEDANDALCALRTSDQYLSMIDGGQKDALYRLDEARRVARTLVTPNAQ